MTVEIGDDEITIPADILAAQFGIQAQTVQPLMRAGAITGRVETGVGEDVGRYRLTFRYEGRSVQFICDAQGTILNVSRTLLVGRTRVLP